MSVKKQEKPSKSKWQKTKDVLPPFCEPVLIWRKGMSITGGYLMECKSWAIVDWDEYEQYLPLHDVDYWQMAPKPPRQLDELKGEKNDYI